MSSSTKVLQVKSSDSKVVNDDEAPARDQAKSRLRISELRYRRLFEAARDGILITAYAGIDDRKRALAAGYEMHIPKPFVAAELISAAIFLTERHSGLA